MLLSSSTTWPYIQETYSNIFQDEYHFCRCNINSVIQSSNYFFLRGDWTIKYFLIYKNSSYMNGKFFNTRYYWLKKMNEMFWIFAFLRKIFHQNWIVKRHDISLIKLKLNFVIKESVYRGHGVYGFCYFLYKTIIVGWLFFFYFRHKQWN